MEGGGPFDGPLNILLTPFGYEVSSTIWQRSLRTENLRALLQLEDDNNGDEDHDLILIVDTREFSILSILEAANLGFRYEQRSLPVGDFTWVWRSDKSDEYMAGYIVERKAIEDLSTSIKDGRYEEQRRRLARAPGIYQVIYVVEGTYSESAQRNPTLLPETSLNTAIRHTELSENFSVLITTNVADTAQTLIEIHTRIMSKGFKQEEDFTTYRDFSQEIHNSNSLTIAQVTSKMLRSLPGIGDEAIMALHEFFVKTGKGGLTLANVASALTDPNINETIKSVTGAKRIPFSAPALAILRQQYSPT
jgi:ERCC4-type nuclease